MGGHKHDQEHDHCGCGHDHDHDHDHEHEAVFELTDEEGNVHEMVMVYQFETGDQAYAVLLDRHDLEADGIIFRIEEEDGQAFLVNIEDEEEWNRVVAIYNEIVEEEEQ